MHSTPETIASRIADALAADDRPMAWVADKAGIPYTTFQRKMSLGGDTFTVRDLAAIASVLGRPVASLLPSTAPAA